MLTYSEKVSMGGYFFNYDYDFFFNLMNQLFLIIIAFKETSTNFI